MELAGTNVTSPVDSLISNTFHVSILNSSLELLIESGLSVLPLYVSLNGFTPFSVEYVPFGS